MYIMSRKVEISVLSWNCLADCYAHGTSIGKKEKSEPILAWPVRSKTIFDILRFQNADIVCLQEVDHFEESYKPFLDSLNYCVIYLQRSGREDGVLIAFKRDKFFLVDKEMVQFDDLALAQIPHMPFSRKERLKKRNVAIILQLRAKQIRLGEERHMGPTFTVSTTHLYWNPISPRIKYAQANYLLSRIAAVCQKAGSPPSASILTGDFNSLPKSQIYEYITTGTRFPLLGENTSLAAVERACSVFSVGSKNGKGIAFLCDMTLGRLARWLRLLGVDAALENDKGGKMKSHHKDHSYMFERARREGRIIVTTSVGMMQRTACPEAFLVRTTVSLERSLASLLNYYNVKLSRSNFLSICGKCGGRIETCSNDDPRIKGDQTPIGKQLYICDNCHQVYWWSDSVNGSSARARRLAESLFSIVEADGKARQAKDEIFCCQNSAELEEGQSCLENKPSLDLSDDSNGKMQTGTTRSQHKEEKMSVQDWLRYKSAFLEVNGREPKYTNINGSFRGTLDYIFVGGLCKVRSANIKDSFRLDKHKKSIYPNKDWPSDHMLITASLVLQTNLPSGRSPFSRCVSSLN